MLGRTIETSIDIAALASQVWQVLTAFDRFPEWSEFILSVEGSIAQGQKIVVRLNDGGGEMIFKPRIVANRESEEFAWRGVVGASWMFTGEHRFTLEDLGDGRTRVVHSEHFSGLLVPLLWQKLTTRTREAFKAFNEALRLRAEATPA
ncbi:MAG: SRPBCC domain-containing protein [Pseudomonadota bacterium]